MAEEGKVEVRHRRGRKIRTRAVSRRRPRNVGRGDNAQKNSETRTLLSLFACIGVLVIATLTIISVFDDRNVFDIVLGSGSESVLASDDMDIYLIDEDVPTVASPEEVLEDYRAKQISATEHDYDWEKLYTNGLYRYYCEGEEISSKVGIDVSYYQGAIDWKKVAADGIEFAIIRLGFRGYSSGKIVLDETYKENIKGATEAGIDVGLYFFTQAVTTKEAKEEAQFVLDNIGKYDIKYPIVIDTEAIDDGAGRSHAADLSPDELTSICKAFCDTINKAGYNSSIYASKSWFINNLDLEKLENYDKWLAHYTEVTTYPFEFDIWQYTSDGRVDGINGRVDLNISFRDY